METKNENIEELKIEDIEIMLKEVKKDMIKEIYEEIKIEKNKTLIVDLKILIKTLQIITIKNININTIKSNHTAETVPWKQITFYKKKFKNYKKNWLYNSIYHELTHYIWRDNIIYNIVQIKKLKLEFSNREMITKILVFRSHMIKNWLPINMKSINDIFSLVENKRKNDWKIERIDLFTIYKNFYWKKDKLLLLLQNLVKLHELKKEIQIV